MCFAKKNLPRMGRGRGTNCFLRSGQGGTQTRTRSLQGCFSMKSITEGPCGKREVRRETRGQCCLFVGHMTGGDLSGVLKRKAGFLRLAVRLPNLTPSKEETIIIG